MLGPQLQRVCGSSATTLHGRAVALQDARDLGVRHALGDPHAGDVERLCGRCRTLGASVRQVGGGHRHLRGERVHPWSTAPSVTTRVTTSPADRLNHAVCEVLAQHLVRRPESGRAAHARPSSPAGTRGRWPCSTTPVVTHPTSLRGMHHSTHTPPTSTLLCTHPLDVSDVLDASSAIPHENSD